MVLINVYDSIEDNVRIHLYLYVSYRNKKKSSSSPFDVVYFDRNSKSVEERKEEERRRINTKRTKERQIRRRVYTD